jgi:hypothetical protein
MPPFFKTTAGAREIGIAPSHLYSLIRSGKVPAPPKDSSGDYLWDQDALEAAREALAVDRRRKAVTV